MVKVASEDEVISPFIWNVCLGQFSFLVTKCIKNAPSRMEGDSAEALEAGKSKNIVLPRDHLQRTLLLHDTMVGAHR